MNQKKQSATRNQPPIILLTGASGAGKSTVLDTLLMQRTNPIKKFVTCTTRPMRPGERDGREYHFLTRDAFEKNIAHGRFYEWAVVYNNYYGSSKTEMARLLKGKKAIVMILDVQGTRTIKRHHPEAISIFIDAPTPSLRARLKDRGSDMNDMKRRLAEITKEKRYRNSADVVLLNRDGDLEKTVLAIQQLIRNAVGRTSKS
jgi:guanylate kinase